MTDDRMSTNGMTDAMLPGSFAGLNDNAVSGKASAGNDELKLGGFSSDQDPDLHVHLTKGTDEAVFGAAEPS